MVGFALSQKRIQKRIQGEADIYPIYNVSIKTRQNKRSENKNPFMKAQNESLNM